LVQTGDVMDRGPDPRKIIDLLMRLESQAKDAGGRVHALIGNHEAMNIYGDLRHVADAAFAGFSNTGRPSNEGKPAGYSEYRRMFGSDGKYGGWIRRHNTVIRIDDTVFAHAGIGPKFSGLTIREINDRIRQELIDISKLEGGMAKDPEGPLWYRGMARGNEEQLMPHLDAVLAKWQARRMVVGHTFADGAVTPRFGGKVLMVDVGLSRLYDQFSRLACLVIENGKPYALHRANRLELPTDSGPGLLRYLKEAAAIDPPPSSLLPRIAALEKQLAVPGGAPAAAH
ncbi:MAG TPA: metallophosphoesterase, partial [Bryobacteraceae bacterium]|nr:metallophosphoesterase [Bryobacteraceae bacterium]